LRNRKWERIFKGQAASESKKNIEKKIKEEKRADEELMRKGNRRKDRRRSKYNNYDYYNEDDYDQYEDYYYEDDNYSKSNRNFKKKGKKYQEYTKKDKSKPKGKVGSKCKEKTEELLNEFYKTKVFDNDKYKKVWDLSEENASNIVEFLENYLEIFMDKGRENEAEVRRGVIYEWMEQEKMNVDEFLKGFNSGHKVCYQEFSDKFKYLEQLSKVLCWVVVNYDLDISQLVIDKKIKGKELDDEDDIEDLQYFYVDFFKKLKTEIENIEDEALRKSTLEKFEVLDNKTKAIFA
jgi:hypothetical protein